MTSDVDSSQIPAPQAPKPNPWQRLGGVLFSPGETMKSIAERPDWVVPLIVLIVLSLAANILTTPKIDFVTEMREQMLEQGAPEEKVEEMVEGMGKFQKFMAPLTVITIPIFLVIIAGVLFGAFKLFGGAGGFLAAFAVTVYSWMPLLIKGLITTAVVMPRESVAASELQTIVRSNLAFLADPKESPAAVALLSSLDVFTTWSVILLIIGFAFVSRFSRAKAAAIIVPMWLFYVLVKTGLASLQG